MTLRKSLAMILTICLAAASPMIARSEDAGLELPLVAEEELTAPQIDDGFEDLSGLAIDVDGLELEAEAPDIENAESTREEIVDPAEDDAALRVNAGPVSIPGSAKLFNGHAYKLYNSGKTWSSAKRYCEYLGGHLASITTSEEQAFIEKLLSAGRRNIYWIGGFRSNSGWRWVTGEAWGYSNWAGGQPDNFTGTENKLMVYRNSNPLASSSLGEWNDLNADCTCKGETFFGKRNFGFICEWDDAGEVKPKSVKLNKTSLSLKVGETFQLVATLSPANAIKKLSWTSSKPKYATVSGSGLVTAKKPGTTTVMVTTTNNRKAECSVVVSEVLPTAIKLDKNKATLKKGDKLKLKATLTPENTTNKDVFWFGSRPYNAKVDDNGVVTAKRPGKAVIKARSRAVFSLVDKCTVTVPGTYRALLIGQNEYANNPLKGCINDANAMKMMLDGLGDKYVTSKVRKNRTANQIMDDIETYLGSATEDDVSLFFYSGHGYNDKGGYYQGALCGVDGSLLSTDSLANALGKVKGRVIVIIDACHSGALISSNGGAKTAGEDFDSDAFIQGVLQAFKGGNTANTAEFRKSKYIVLVAAGFNETSSEGIASIFNWKRQGKFTSSLIKGMGTDFFKGTYSGKTPADGDGNNGVSVRELYDYIKGKVGKKQTTGMYAESSSEILFAR